MTTDKDVLRVLFIEDNSDDVELVLFELNKGYKVVWQIVDTEAALTIALDDEWDVVLCDYVLPRLSAEKALIAVKSSANGHGVPFIVISGAVREDAVLELQKQGANDFVSKDHIGRLPFVIQRERKSNKERAAERLRATILVREALDQTIAAFGKALELRDMHSAGHTQRATDLALRLANHIGVPHADFVALHRGAMLHDIGKLGLPDSILLKRGFLEDDERKLMQKHPELAYNMLKRIPYLEAAIPVVVGHHERWNGTGYPKGLKGDEIPFLARLFSVIDVYDALSNNRPYRESWDKARVIAYLLEEKGITLDPEIVDAFVEMVGRA
jgi:response regulator RpfG family c-di-GMP phosphodiesterase